MGQEECEAASKPIPISYSEVRLRTALYAEEEDSVFLHEEGTVHDTLERDADCFAESAIAVDEKLLAQLVALGLPSSFGAGNEKQQLSKARRKKKIQKSRTLVRCYEDATECTLDKRIAEEPAALLTVCDDGAEATTNSAWVPVWDDHYQCYYFYNSESRENTWDAPEGFEQYANYVRPAVEEEAKEESGQEVTALNKTRTVEIATPICEEQTEAVTKSVWVPIWSDHYQRYYFSNTETLESSWDAPEGLEQYAKSAVEEESKEETGQELIVLDRTTTVEIQTPGSCISWEEQTEAVLDALSSRRKRNVKITKELSDAGISPAVLKYWHQRYNLFSRFDSGIKMDEEGWFSVTPEAIAKHQALRCSSSVVIDGFAGVGGNTIQFALRSEHVIAIDKDPQKIAYAKHNAEIYGVSDRIKFIVGDFFELAPTLKADVLFLSPPWGGPDYLKTDCYDLSMLQPKDGVTLFKAAQGVAPNIVLYLPRNVDLEQIAKLSQLSDPPFEYEVEKNFVDDRLKAITVYYGDFLGC